MGMATSLQDFFSLGLESQSSIAQDCPRDFCPGPKKTRICVPFEDFGTAKIIGTA